MDSETIKRVARAIEATAGHVGATYEEQARAAITAYIEDQVRVTIYDYAGALPTEPRINLISGKIDSTTGQVTERGEG